MDDRISFSEFVAGATAVAFVCSVLYIFGISSSSKIPVFDYLLITDYLTLAIKWLTPTMIYAAVGILLNLLTRRIERGQSDEEIAASTKNPKRTLRLRKLPWIALRIIIVLVALFYFIGWKLGFISSLKFYEVTTGMLPVIWIIFAGWYMTIPKLVQNWNRTTIWIFIFIPALLIFSLFRGMHEGERILSDSHPDVTIVQHDSEYHAQVIMSLNEYLLIKKKGQEKVEAHRRSDIVRIEYDLAR